VEDGKSDGEPSASLRIAKGAPDTSKHSGELGGVKSSVAETKTGVERLQSSKGVTDRSGS